MYVDRYLQKKRLQTFSNAANPNTYKGSEVEEILTSKGIEK